MNELKVNLENLSNEERKQLTSLLEKAQNPKKTGTWFPGTDEEYWFVTAQGASSMKNTGHVVDRQVFEIQDPCQTEVEALKKYERNLALIKVNRQVRDLIANEYPNWVCDWNDDCQQKFYPYFNHNWGYVSVDASHKIQTQFLFEYAPSGVWERIDEVLIKKSMGV